MNELIFRYFGSLIAVTLLYGCGNLQSYDKAATYKMTLPISVNGELVNGGGSVSFSPSYLIHIKNSKKIDFLHVSSCARSIDVEGPYFKKRVIKNKTEYSFIYNPLEFERGCNLEFIVADKKGENKIGNISFQPSSSPILASVACNGSVVDMDGTGFCQSKSGLLQRIVFDRPMRAMKIGGCQLEGYKDMWTFEMPLGSSQCVFMDDIGNFFEMHFYGWNRILQEKL